MPASLSAQEIEALPARPSQDITTEPMASAGASTLKAEKEGPAVNGVNGVKEVRELKSLPATPQALWLCRSRARIHFRKIKLGSRNLDAAPRARVSG